MSMLESEPESGVEMIDLTLDEENPDTLSYRLEN